ncbi:MAG: efflux RND transporter periplasmic adaptor subunit [bacterium]
MNTIWRRSAYARAVWLLLVCSFSSSADEFPAVDCVISPYQIVELGSAVPGVIDRISVERSDFVRKGQIIAELASGVERAAVALARARAQVEPEINVWQINVEFDEKRKERIHSLYDNKVVSDDNKDEADREAKLSTWKLQQARDLKKIRQHELERAVEQLKQKTIASPIDGFILEKYKLVGEYVEDQAIVRIAQLDPLNVEAIVPIELFGKIPVGMLAEVHPETLSAGVRTALVTVVDRTGDAGSGTFGVRLEMPNPALELPAGLKCDLRFVENSVPEATAGSMPSKLSNAWEQISGSARASANKESNIPKKQIIEALSDSELGLVELDPKTPQGASKSPRPSARVYAEPWAGAQKKLADQLEMLMASSVNQTLDKSGAASADGTDVGGSSKKFHPIQLPPVTKKKETSTSVEPELESTSTSEIDEDSAVVVIDQNFSQSTLRSANGLDSKIITTPR